MIWTYTDNFNDYIKLIDAKEGYSWIAAVFYAFLLRRFTVLYAISFFLFLFFLISVHTQPVSFGFAIYALICIGVAQLLNSFVSDMRDTINEMEQTMKEYRDQLWRDIRKGKKTLDQK